MFSLTPFHRGDLDTIFEGLFNDRTFPAFFTNSGQMKVDIKENEKSFLVEAEMPGAKKEEISLDVKDNVLTISVEKKDEVSEENEKYLRKERRYGSMTRSFALENIDEEKISAKFENGILSVLLPKKSPEPAKNSKIQIE